MRKKAIQIAIIIIGFSLIVNLTKDIFRLLKAGEQVKLAERKVEGAKLEKEEALKKKEHYASEEFIEETARDKLNMARLGETIVILPQNLAEVIGRKEKEMPLEFPNWQKWWELFW